MDPLEQDEPTVFFVGNDPQVIRALRAALKPNPARLEVHSSPHGFFNACSPAQPGCVVWDDSAPGPSGEAVFDQLARRKIRLPVILVSAATETPLVVRAMRAGALNYLEKPASREMLQHAVHEALAHNTENRERIRRITKIERRLKQLTAGEREVLDMLLHGDSNREIAEALAVSVRAIETRRAKLMSKMKARTVAHLVRMVLTVHSEPSK